MFRQTLGLYLCLKTCLGRLRRTQYPWDDYQSARADESDGGGGSHFRKFMTRDIFLGVEKCQIFVFAKMKNDHTQSRMIIQVSELSGHVERHFSPLQLRSVLLILVFHQNSRKWKNTPKML